MANVTLENRNGSLYLKGEILIHFYGSGDVDTLSWPLADGERDQLDEVLYTAYQVGELEEGDSVSAPDGSLLGRCEGVHFIAA